MLLLLTAQCVVTVDVDVVATAVHNVIDVIFITNIKFTVFCLHHFKNTRDNNTQDYVYVILHSVWTPCHEVLSGANRSEQLIIKLRYMIIFVDFVIQFLLI